MLDCDIRVPLMAWDSRKGRGSLDIWAHTAATPRDLEMFRPRRLRRGVAPSKYSRGGGCARAEGRPSWDGLAGIGATRRSGPR